MNSLPFGNRLTHIVFIKSFELISKLFSYILSTVLHKACFKINMRVKELKFVRRDRQLCANYALTHVSRVSCSRGEGPCTAVCHRIIYVRIHDIMIPRTSGRRCYAARDREGNYRASCSAFLERGTRIRWNTSRVRRLSLFQFDRLIIIAREWGSAMLLSECPRWARREEWLWRA